MAGTYTYNVNVNLVNGTYTYNFAPNGNITQNNLGAVSQVVSIPTTPTTISTTGLTTAGYCFVQSLDATNYVQIGTTVSGTFYPIIKIEAGEFAVFRLDPSVTLQMKANTAAVEVAYCIQND